jgi:hypothetical protein
MCFVRDPSPGSYHLQIFHSRPSKVIHEFGRVATQKLGELGLHWGVQGFVSRNQPLYTRDTKKPSPMRMEYSRDSEDEVISKM